MRSANALWLSVAFLMLSGASTRPKAERSALDRVRAYVDAHNAHNLALTTSFYADDAEFRLNGGRPPVYGREAIRQLEAFDVVAGSEVDLLDLAAHRDGTNIVVTLRSVIEHSRIFAALGLPSITTEPVDAFIVRPDGFFAKVVQPEFKLACRQLIAPAFRSTLAWLQATTDPRAALLTTNGTLDLSAATIPMLLTAIADWRAATGWSPDAILAADCARA